MDESTKRKKKIGKQTKMENGVKGRKATAAIEKW